jgi:hypothetical protein
VLEHLIRRALSAAAVAAFALAVPLGASAVAPTTTVLSGLSGPFELARDADGNLYYTDQPNGTTRLSVLRQGNATPTPLFSVSGGSTITDVGFDGQKNAYAIVTQTGSTADTFEVRRIAAGTGAVTTLLTKTATPSNASVLTSGSTIQMIEPAPDGTVYFAGTAAAADANASKIWSLAPGAQDATEVANFPGDPTGGGFPPGMLSLVLGPDGTLAFDVGQPNGLRNVYTLVPAPMATPKLIASRATGRALGFDDAGNLYVGWRTYNNRTSVDCADSTTFGVLRFTPVELANASPNGTDYSQGTFPGANLLILYTSTNARVGHSGEVFFTAYQAACGSTAPLNFKTRRLLGIPSGGGVPVVLNEDVTDPPTADLGYIGVAVGPTAVYRSSYRLGNIVSIGLQYLSSPVNWAANNSVDFNGDHITDLGALYRGLSPADSLWYAPGTFQIYFGATSDIPVPGDYDGDGETDAVIFRPSTGLWYGPRTGAAQIVIQQIVGQAGDIPIPGDYDGDGKTDPAYYRPSTQLFFAVLSGGGTKSATFGAPGDVPVPRDYDGDGKTDFGIYRADATPDHLGLWYAPVSGGEAPYQIYFGAPGDVPVPGDYNGDKRAEAVIFRPSTGLWYGPFNGAPGLFQLLLGGPGDVPIPGYYDADQTEDPAIYRKASGLWFALLSGGGVSRVDGLGQPTDVPVQKRPALAGGL